MGAVLTLPDGLTITGSVGSLPAARDPRACPAALEPYELKSFASTRNMSGAFDWEN